MPLCVTDDVRLSAVRAKLAAAQQLINETNRIIEYMTRGAPDIPQSGSDYLVEPVCED